jgi:hypothetical protein
MQKGARKMKTSRTLWKLTALVLVGLILSITPGTAQNSVAQNPAALPVPGSGDHAAAEDRFDSAQVDAFVSRLESDGFVVQEGHMGRFDYAGVCCAAGSPFDCSYFNPSSPYLVAYLPLSPGQTTQELPFGRDPAYPDQALAWRLRPDEAVVLVGLTPPSMRYFGFQSYRWYTMDEQGHRVRKWNNFGDQTNQLTINTAGTPNATPGDPFNKLTIRITTADAGIDARVRQAARRAGYPPPIMNTEPIPQSIVRMGIDEDGDQFNSSLRMAAPDAPDALDSYIADPPVRILRVTPKTASPVYPAPSPDPFPIPGFRAHGTGQTEFALLPAVRDLRKAILGTYSGLQAQELPSEQSIFYGLHHMDVNDDGLGPSTDALYLGTIEDFGTLSEDDFIVVYGANHQKTGKAMYMNVALYGLTKQITPGGVDDPKLAGTAASYLGSTYSGADKLYVYKFARHCDGEANCYEVPYGCCGQQGTPACFGTPGCPGVGADEKVVVYWRAYLDPLAKAGPDPAEVLLDRAIKFSPKH